MADVFDHDWLGGLFADPAMAALWSPQAQLSSMRAFEIAWSRALGRAGLVDEATAEAAAKAAASVTFDLADLRAGMARDGVVAPRLVAQIVAVSGPARRAVHMGATSQDLIDTATAIAMRDSLSLIDQRLANLTHVIIELDRCFGSVPMMGRTRMQAATPITVHDRIMPWLLPLSEHRVRLSELRPRVSRVQVGGASGDRAALGDSGDAIAADVAHALDLGDPPRAWHAMRDGVAEFASFLSLVTGSLGKIGQDIVLMAQQGISEISLSGGGASSAMPHKHNPILAELLVTLARFNAVQVSAAHHSMVHEQERSGAAWALEWMVLPSMAQATGRSLTAARTLLSQVTRIGTPAKDGLR